MAGRRLGSADASGGRAGREAARNNGCFPQEHPSQQADGFLASRSDAERELTAKMGRREVEKARACCGTDTTPYVQPKNRSWPTTKNATRQSRNRRQTGLNAETQRARRNAEAKSFFFLLSLRSSATLSVSALILRRLRGYWSTAVQGVELAKGTVLTHPSAQPPFSLWVLCVLCG